MTATAFVTWGELMHQSQMTGQLPIVIPVGSYCIAGLFAVKPEFEIPFALACFNKDGWVRARAACAAVISSRADLGMDL